MAWEVRETQGVIFHIGSIGTMLGTTISERILDRVPQSHLMVDLAQLINAVLLATTPFMDPAADLFYKRVSHWYDQHRS